jgi:hypothetical protein
MPDALTISITGETVTISGEVKLEQHKQEGQTYLDELYQGRFQLLPLEGRIGKRLRTHLIADTTILV